MTRTLLKKYWITLSSLICFGTVITLACAGDWGPEYGTSNFTPEVFVDTTYSPFFYSMQFYYGINYDEGHITRFNIDNAKDWSAWLNAPIPVVNHLLDSTSSKAIDSALSWASHKSAVRPSCLADLKTSEKLTTFLTWLQLAKQSEDYSLSPIVQEWQRDTTQHKPRIDYSRLGRQLQQHLTTAADPFIKERYWFQLLRYQFFNDAPNTTIATFNNYKSAFPHNTLYYRSLSYTAGAFRQLKEISTANYLYSRVFDSCVALRTVAHYSFRPQDESDWRSTLALCKNAEEKATLWQMLGIFYSDPQRAMSEIYQLDPKSDKLNLLLARSINASEQRFGQTYAADKSDKSSDSSDHQLRLLVTRIADAHNTAAPWIWQLAAGYLSMLDKQYAAASNYYNKASTTVPKEKLPQAQYRLLKLLNTIAAAKTIDASLETRLLPEIAWLRETQNKAPDPNFRNSDAFLWVKKTMAAKYLLTGEKVKSECFLHQSAFFSDDRNVEALKAFFAKEKKTPYEILCDSLSVISRGDCFEYQAVLRCMNDDIDGAIAYMQQADAGSKNSILPGNPFNARINDCHDCDHAAAQKIKYTKLGFLQKLKEIKDKIAAGGSDAFTNAVLMGNAQYNITEYGNARAFYECKVLGSDISQPWFIDSIFRAPLTGMHTATGYYQLALTRAATDEQRAKCQYLLAKCQRNTWYNKTWYNDSKNEWSASNGPDFLAWDGFKNLKQYSGTQYYKEVLKECGYFQTYIQKGK